MVLLLLAVVFLLLQYSNDMQDLKKQMEYINEWMKWQEKINKSLVAGVVFKEDLKEPEKEKDLKDMSKEEKKELINKKRVSPEETIIIKHTREKILKIWWIIRERERRT
jgi:hypothetical protein